MRTDFYFPPFKSNDCCVNLGFSISGRVSDYVRFGPRDEPANGGELAAHRGDESIEHSKESLNMQKRILSSFL